MFKAKAAFEKIEHGSPTTLIPIQLNNSRLERLHFDNNTYARVSGSGQSMLISVI